MKNKIYRSIILIWNLFPFKKILRSILNFKFFKKIKIKLYKDLRYKGEFDVEFRGAKFKIYNPSYTTIENEIFWYGIDGYELISFSIWQKLATEADCIVDIGANTGIFSLVAASSNSDALIFAYEPVKRTLEIFQKNIKINPNFNITATNIAISNKVGKSLFYDVNTASQLSASLNPDKLNHHNNIVEYNVNVSTLDNEIKSKIDLIKIDVEMHEFEVLEGMINIISNYRPSLIIEILTDELKEKIIDFMLKYNYEIFNINENKGLEKNNNEIKFENKNFLFIQHNKINLIANFIN